VDLVVRGEDTELGWRLFAAGLFFVPANRAAIYHQEQEETHPEEGWRQEGRAANADLIRSKIPHRFYRRLADPGPFEVPKVSWVVTTPAGRRTKELLAQMQAQTSGDWEALYPGDYWRGGDPRLRLLPDAGLGGRRPNRIRPTTARRGLPATVQRRRRAQSDGAPRCPVRTHPGAPRVRCAARPLRQP